MDLLCPVACICLSLAACVCVASPEYEDTQRAFGAKMTSYQRRCDVITTSFSHQMPSGQLLEIMALLCRVVFTRSCKLFCIF